jgi:hypothetical protein
MAAGRPFKRSLVQDIGSSIELAALQDRPIGKRKVEEQYEVDEWNEHAQAEPPWIARFLEDPPPRPNEDEKEDYQ